MFKLLITTIETESLLKKSSVLSIINCQYRSSDCGETNIEYPAPTESIKNPHPNRPANAQMVRPLHQKHLSARASLYNVSEVFAFAEGLSERKLQGESI